MRGSAQKIVAFLAWFLRSTAIPLALLLLGGGGCDTFNGSVLALSIAYPQIPLMPPMLPPNNFHLEFWALLNNGGSTMYQRLPAQVDSTDPADWAKFPGFTIVRAIDPNDPCVIRALDHDDNVCADINAATPDVCNTQMFSQPAQGVPPDGSSQQLLQLGLEVQARKVTAPDTHFNAINPADTGQAPSPLLALVQYNTDWGDDPRLSLPATSTTNAGDLNVAQQRHDKCLTYRDGSPDGSQMPNPNFYVGNPHQYTKPLAGILFGFFSFQTCSTATPPSCPVATPSLPDQDFSGINFSVPFPLDNIQGLLATFENQQNPSAPNMAAQLFTSMPPEPSAMAGRGVIEFVIIANTNPNLSPPMFTTAVGTAAIVTDLASGLN